MGRIVWIASYPKSGNTWVRAFLHDLLIGEDAAFDINRMARTAGNEAAKDNFTPFDPRPWQLWTARDIARIRPKAQAAFAARHRRDTFCKTHLGVMRVHGSPTINMKVTAGAIYIVRDPLDVAVSYADHQGLSLDGAIALMNLENHVTPSTTDHVGEPMGSWSQHVDGWTRKADPALLVMRYEDMLAAPARAFARLVAFLQMSPSQSRIERALERSSFAALRRQENAGGFRERPAHQKQFFRSGRAGVWRRALSKDQIAAIVACHGDAMRRFGYREDV